jgi:hypothetical protein
MLTVAGKMMSANLEMEGRTNTAAPMSSPKCNPRSKVSCYSIRSDESGNTLRSHDYREIWQ